MKALFELLEPRDPYPTVLATIKFMILVNMHGVEWGDEDGATRFVRAAAAAAAFAFLP